MFLRQMAKLCGTLPDPAVSQTSENLERSSYTENEESGDEMGVIIQSNEVQGRPRALNPRAEHPALQNGPFPSAIPNPVQKSARRPINWAPSIGWIEQSNILGHSDRRIRIFRLQQVVHPGMGSHHVLHHGNAEPD